MAMAAASPSPLASSVEKTNGAKLSRLLIDGGTMVLRKIFDRYHPPANLVADLNANYHTLNNLLRRRVLHKPQWDLLFPPGGATPDSNTFDITLLFLLLTSICGLTPPPSGWHTKPLPSDTSVEGNLARIKFFRNELYGHVTSTGIDTPTFSALWLEISAVLVSLGLPQAEIDRMKAEHCGEKDFTDVLFEWADSEEEIKSQLKNIRQYQAKTGQTVDEVRQSQIEDQKTLQDSNMKLEEVHEVQTQTQQTVDEVRQTQLEDQKTMQNIKAMVEDVLDFQSVAVTQKTIDEKRHTQLGDRETVVNSKVYTNLQEDLEDEREKSRGNEILKKLAKIETVKNVRYHADRYVEGTRLSIFLKVGRWLSDGSSPNRVMVISGNAGMGKSVISAVMCEKMQKAGRLAGTHFCQHDRARHRNPKVMLQSLASQLCDILPDYKKALVEKLSRNLGVEINNMEVKDLFEVLFEEPLTSLNDPDLTYVMVIDGLDESEFQGRNELLDAIANYFRGLPQWIRFLVTTRPEINIVETLKSLHPLQLDPDVEENLNDILLCFEKQIGHLLQSEHRENMLKALVQQSEGVMLYAHYLVDSIKKKVSLGTPELLDSILPTGISSVYHSYFKRLETELRNELKVTEDKFLNFLHSLAAAREPLPLGFVSKLLLPVKSTSVTQEKVNAAIACVSALLPVQDECIHFFHKSVKDWLIEKSSYRHDYFIEKGHEVLSELCIDELDELKRNVVDCAQFSDTTRYALRHGVQHMLQLEDSRLCSPEEVVKKFVLNLELVYAKLCVNVTLAFEDVICVQKQLDIEKRHEALTTLLVLLRKHIVTLENLPHTIFQTLLNEGGPELSTEALNLLETKYSEIAYLEYLQKEDLPGRVQTKFHCSAAVACFDVSPQLDYMVCECVDFTIQLWSLHTGKLLWKQDVRKMKYDYCYEYEPYRIPQYYFHRFFGSLFDPVKSLYRSVVFHPTQDLVLPGILNHAYSFAGELRPLFPSSKCRFWVGSISADKMNIITDCPNDARTIVMWNLTDGSEGDHFTWNADILSFARSRDGRLLAISDLSCCIGVLDVVNGFKTLLTGPLTEICGMIKFSPDNGFLHCLAFTRAKCTVHCFKVDLRNVCNFSSCSETGYLLGDPFCLPSERDSLPWTPQLAFVLNKQSVLRVSLGSHIIEILYVDKLTNNSPEDSNAVVEKVAFSLNGDTLYVVTKKSSNLRTLLAWDISSAKLIAEKSDFESGGRFLERNLVTVKAGVLVQTSAGTLELWNSKLSQCIRCWSDSGAIRVVVRLADERVACKVETTFQVESVWKGVCTFEEERKVVILDTTMESIVPTVTFRGRFIACNSKCHVITAHDGKFQMQRGDVVLWERLQRFTACDFLQCNIFSPSEQYCVLAGFTATEAALYVLYADSGKTFKLCSCGELVPRYLDCKFVSDEECVTSVNVGSTSCCLRLFNVKSGDLLSAIATQNEVHSLAAYPPKCLIAVDFKDSFKVLQVKLPGDQRKKSKRSVVMIKPKELKEYTAACWNFQTNPLTA